MGTETVSLDIPGQQTSLASINEHKVSEKDKYGHWLGFWYGWWLCWWAGFIIASVPVSFFFSFLGQKLCHVILTVFRKFGSCPVGLSYEFSICEYLMIKRNKEGLSNEEDFSEETSRWKNLMPGIVLGIVIGAVQIINCLMRHHSIGAAIIGLIFGFVLIVPNAFIFKML